MRFIALRLKARLYSAAVLSQALQQSVSLRTRRCAALLGSAGSAAFGGRPSTLLVPAGRSSSRVGRAVSQLFEVQHFARSCRQVFITCRPRVLAAVRGSALCSFLPAGLHHVSAARSRSCSRFSTLLVPAGRSSSRVGRAFSQLFEVQHFARSCRQVFITCRPRVLAAVRGSALCSFLPA